MSKLELCDDPKRAAELLRRGALVAFPTETVYGLGVDATDARAVERLFAAKGRPTNNPLIVHIGDHAQIYDVAVQVPDLARALLERFAPGPITVVVPRRAEIVPAVTAGLPTVGVRIPDVAQTRAMLRLAARPIAAPSANRSGRPSCTTYQSVIEDFGDAIDAVLLGEPAEIGLESTVVDCTREVARVLRPGGITLAQLHTVDQRIVMASRLLELGDNSPGRLHPHYRPKARVVLIGEAVEASPSATAMYAGLQEHPEHARFGWHVAFDSVHDYGRGFYELLREADRRGLTVIFCQRVADSGFSAALNDRMERAAEE